MPKSTRPSPNDKKPPRVVATSAGAGTTNKTDGSLIQCVVSLDKGEWVCPTPCAIYKIDLDAKFPDIAYEIKTDHAGPFHWSWELKWNVLACPQKNNKHRFKPKKTKFFVERGAFSSDSKRWTANLNNKTIGGELTVKVKAGGITFLRKTIIKGVEPGREMILAELELYAAMHKSEVELAKRIFQHESKFSHFYSDEQPLVSFDNGYGMGQATTPEPSFEQVWNWKKHIHYIVTTVIREKREMAHNYLKKHGNFSESDLDMETLVYYNGANFHYLVWNDTERKWKVNEKVLCDPTQSNAGWDMELAINKDKTLMDLRKGDGSKPKYTGRCYAEHIKNQREAK